MPIQVGQAGGQTLPQNPQLKIQNPATESFVNINPNQVQNLRIENNTLEVQYSGSWFTWRNEDFKNYLQQIFNG